jgi:hypothetical protein
MGNSATGTNTQVAPTTSAAIMLKANTGRISALLRNQGTVDIYYGYSASLTTANGVLLQVGDVLLLNSYKGDVYGITASGTGSVGVSELTP